MRYLMYLVPAIAGSLFYGYIILFLDGLAALSPLTWVWIGLMYLGSFLMIRQKWWGCVPGLTVGLILLNAGLEGQSPVISEAAIGAFIFCYYTAVGYAKKRRKL